MCHPPPNLCLYLLYPQSIPFLTWLPRCLTGTWDFTCSDWTGSFSSHPDLFYVHFSHLHLWLLHSSCCSDQSLSNPPWLLSCSHTPHLIRQVPTSKYMQNPITFYHHAGLASRPVLPVLLLLQQPPTSSPCFLPLAPTFSSQHSAGAQGADTLGAAWAIKSFICMISDQGVSCLLEATMKLW